MSCFKVGLALLASTSPYHKASGMSGGIKLVMQSEASFGRCRPQKAFLSVCQCCESVTATVSTRVTRVSNDSQKLKIGLVRATLMVFRFADCSVSICNPLGAGTMTTRFASLESMFVCVCITSPLVTFCCLYQSTAMLSHILVLPCKLNYRNII